MFENCDVVHVPLIDNQCRFWMIRTKRGVYYDEFIKNEFIAIGWNQLLASSLRIDHTKKQLEVIKNQLKRDYEEKIPGAAYNKCKRFFSEIKKDDIVMIVGSSCITFAYIGDYYEEKDELLTVEHEIETDKKIDEGLIDCALCPYVKRRKITVIKSITTVGPINPYLSIAMAQNRHSLSSLDDYSRIILSSCFDIYQLGEELTVTFRVESAKEINPLVLANFLLSVSNIILPTNETRIAVNTNLHSPGDVTIITRIDALLQQIPILALYVAIVGGRFKDFEVPSIIDFIKKIVQVKRNKEIDGIELEQMRESLRSSKLDNIKKELEIIEIEKRLGIGEADSKEFRSRLQTIEGNFDDLRKASGELEVKPFSDKVIAFDDIKIYTMQRQADK